MLSKSTAKVQFGLLSVYMFPTRMMMKTMQSQMRGVSPVIAVYDEDDGVDDTIKTIKRMMDMNVMSTVDDEYDDDDSDVMKNDENVLTLLSTLNDDERRELYARKKCMMNELSIHTPPSTDTTLTMRIRILAGQNSNAFMTLVDSLCVTH